MGGVAANRVGGREEEEKEEMEVYKECMNQKKGETESKREE